MKQFLIQSPTPNEKKVNDSIRNIKKTKKFMQKYKWKNDVSGLPELHVQLDRLMKEIQPSKRKLNRNQLPLILRSRSSELNEVYQLFLSLQDISKLNQKGILNINQTTEQLVINRATYVFTETLSDIERNEEVMSGEYIPAT